jgi:hypothetical protein
MGDLNYFNGVVKILEVPRKKILDDKFSLIQCRVQLPQIRSNEIVMLNIWGKLSKDIIKNYTIADYILIEGYLYLKPNFHRKLSSNILKFSKKIEVSVVKIYPYVINNKNIIN